MNDISNGRRQSVTQVTSHLARVRDRVQRALTRAGREPDEVTILAVSKQQPAAAIQALFRAGQTDFGENFAQEAMEKISRLEHLEIGWHFIGHVQSNKTRDIAARFQWVHTVDRLKTARRLSDQRPHDSAPLNVCIQVNQAGETQKGGVEPAGVADLARGIMELPGLRLRGLMTIPPAAEDPADSAPFFAELRAQKERLDSEGIRLDTLSMGMSSDLEVAIHEGATIVRIGTAIFGPRPPRTANPSA